MAVVGIDIGGTKIRMAISKTPKEVLFQSSIPTAELGIPVSLEALVGYLREEIYKSKVADSEIQALGVSVAAVVDSQRGYVRIGENIGWRDVPLADFLRSEFGLPVKVDTDAFCGAMAENKLGNAIDQQSFLYIAIGTGIGHAFIFNHKCWRGLHDAANLFGHLKVLFDGEMCYCGQMGCVCQYSSGKGIVQLSQKLLSKCSGVKVKGMEGIIQAYEHGESWAKAAIEQATTRLAFAMSQAYNLLDIECVVLGGGAVSNTFPNLDRLVELLEVMVYPEIRPIILRKGKFGSNAQLIGATLAAFEALA